MGLLFLYTVAMQSIASCFIERISSVLKAFRIDFAVFKGSPWRISTQNGLVVPCRIHLSAIDFKTETALTVSDPFWLLPAKILTKDEC